MAGFQFFNVILYTSLLLLPTYQTWKPGDHSKAELGPRKAKLLMGTYLGVLVLAAPLLLSIGS